MQWISELYEWLNAKHDISAEIPTSVRLESDLKGVKGYTAENICK